MLVPPSPAFLCWLPPVSSRGALPAPLLLGLGLRAAPTAEALPGILAVLQVLRAWRGGAAPQGARVPVASAAEDDVGDDFDARVPT
jgi:hypothetical protein